MPINEREFHPFLTEGEQPNNSSLILGSFPIYSLTNQDNERKIQLRRQTGDFQFFYGSRRNSLWSWYKTYLDDSINACSVQSIQNSLSLNSVSISDVILDCYRNGESALDSDLLSKTWNRDGVRRLLSDKTSRILCTSKQVLKWLDERIVDKNQFELNSKRTEQIQRQLLAGLTDTEVDYGLIKVYHSPKLGKTIEVIATPTPGGGMYRRLDCFGYDPQSNVTNVMFLEEYLTRTFKWLNFRIDL